MPITFDITKSDKNGYIYFTENTDIFFVLRYCQNKVCTEGRKISTFTKKYFKVQNLPQQLLSYKKYQFDTIIPLLNGACCSSGLNYLRL